MRRRVAPATGGKHVRLRQLQRLGRGRRGRRRRCAGAGPRQAAAVQSRVQRRQLAAQVCQIATASCQLRGLGCGGISMWATRRGCTSSWGGPTTGRSVARWLRGARRQLLLAAQPHRGLAAVGAPRAVQPLAPWPGAGRVLNRTSVAAPLQVAGVAVAAPRLPRCRCAAGRAQQDAGSGTRGRPRRRRARRRAVGRELRLVAQHLGAQLARARQRRALSTHGHACAQGSRRARCRLRCMGCMQASMHMGVPVLARHALLLRPRACFSASSAAVAAFSSPTSCCTSASTPSGCLPLASGAPPAAAGAAAAGACPRAPPGPSWRAWTLAACCRATPGSGRPAAT